MTYLVDANILSEPTKISPDPRVIGWLRNNESEIAVDPVILASFDFIASTALVHNLIVATHNRADFEKAGVKVIDPFSS